MSTRASTVVAQLAEMVGDPNFVANPSELAPFEIDGKRPSAAVRPGSAEEVAEVIRFAAAEKLGVIPTAARTKLAIGLPPQKYDLAVDMTGLDRVIAYDPGDLTLSVEAGVPLRKLSGVLAERGQFLPLAVPFFARATVGGTIASGMDSPLRQFYGTARDYILGIEFLTGEGTPAKSGGRVVKNVTGYDLHKLMIGSLGTLGVMTQINFRTFPLPIDSRAFVAKFAAATGALGLRARVAGSPLTPSTMEVLSPGVADLFYSDAAARIEPSPMAMDLLTSKTWAFTAGIAGTGKVLDRCETELRRMADEAGALGVSVLGRDEIPGAFGRKREFVAIALESSPATTILKLSVLPARMNEILAEIGAGAESNSLRWAALARGVGVIYAVLLPDSRGDESRERVVRAANQIQAACARAGGHGSIPWCSREWKPSFEIWGAERADFGQMRKLKAVFDPQGILCVGRFVGGL
jgi:glycolate oxidase FAD binding subunit